LTTNFHEDGRQRKKIGKMKEGSILNLKALKSVMPHFAE
jgi:hypothetical protein